MARNITILLSAIILVAGCSGHSAQSSQTPLIGVSSGFNGSSASLPETYIYAVRKGGGVPVILPLVREKSQAEALIGKLDGLIMSGGEDIAPAYYGETVLNASVGINAVRDTSDFLLLQTAIDCGKPVLGICRGHQLVNVILGGSLYQDLPTQLGVEHRQKESSAVPTHKVGLIKGTRISGLLSGIDSLMTNTHHHQAVKDVAPGLKVTILSADGVVEGCEGKGVMSVQFHPEALIKGGDDTFLPLFEAFVEDCSAGR